MQLAIGGKSLIRYPVARTHWVRWCPTYLGNSQRPHHLYNLAKITKCDINIIYYPTTNTQKGVEESSQLLTFLLPKTGKLFMLQTYKNYNLSFIPSNLTKISNKNCSDERTIFVDMILYLLTLLLDENEWYTCHCATTLIELNTRNFLKCFPQLQPS